MNPTHQVFLAVETNTAFGRETLRGIGAFQHEHGYWDCRIRPWQLGLLPKSPEGLNGAIVRAKDQNEVAHFQEAGIPMINVSASSPVPLKLPTVTVDQQALGRLAAEHLLAKGFRSFGYACLKGRWFRTERFKGFAGKIKAAGLDSPEPFYFAGSLRSHEKTLLEYLRNIPRPGAVFCGNDLIGRDLIEVLRANHIRIPEEIAVLGVDNDQLICELPHPQLSSISPSAFQTGYEAARWLEEWMNGIQPGPDMPLLRLIPPGEVMERHSSNVFAVEDIALQRALTHIRDHLTGPIPIPDLAQSAGICRKTLEVRFQKYLARTPAEEIRNQRVQKARRLLIEGTLSMSDIAEACGLASQAALSTLVKSRTGRTPMQIRNSSRVG